MPAPYAYNECMSRIQYTVRGVPQELDGELRKEARASGKTLNAVVLETLRQAKLPSGQVVYEDLDWFSGSSSGDESGFDDAQEWLGQLPSELG